MPERKSLPWGEQPDGSYVLDTVWQRVIPLKNCVGCAHWMESESKQAHTCKAFPTLIPEAVWTGEHDHRQPYEGDGGVQFAPRMEQPEKRVA